jgi:hypothetical protein
MGEKQGGRAVGRFFSRRQVHLEMNSLVRIVSILIAVFVVGGIAALSMWDIPAPTGKIEKVIPDERFQR